MLLPFFLYWLLLYFQESECHHQPLPDFDIAEIVQTVINEVKISNSNANFKFFMDHVVPDIELFIYKTGQTRLKMYATTLQKFYTSGTNLQEADIKRILKAVVTKILSKIDVLDGKFSQEVFLTDTDKSIVFYLAGAVLKWGITKFKGEERSYCQSHTSSESSDFPEVYHFRFLTTNRGLIVPNLIFYDLILDCEKELRKQRCLRSVDVSTIVNALKQKHSFFAGLHPENAATASSLLQRYIRLRCHISCKHKLQFYQITKKLSLAQKNGSIRRALKRSFPKK